MAKIGTMAKTSGELEQASSSLYVLRAVVIFRESWIADGQAYCGASAPAAGQG